jgi:hypothetical protein
MQHICSFFDLKMILNSAPATQPPEAIWFLAHLWGNTKFKSMLKALATGL